MVNMGDTVKLTKGRIGLIRYIGKTQFGLGEWIGIELYNELIKTRHNGAVLGKRYFRCPPHRGVFIRRSIIRENIAVLDIQPSINQLRTKEKKMKSQRKNKNKQNREAKKLKNEKKREAKRLKIQAKYANCAKPMPITTARPQKTPIKKEKKLARSQTPTSSSRQSRSPNRAPNRTSTPKGRYKSPTVPDSVNTTSFQLTKRKQRPRTPTDPMKKTKKRSKTPTTSTSTPKKKTKGKKKKQPTQSKKKRCASASSSKRYHSDSENADEEEEEDEEEFPHIPNIMSVAEPMIARQVKVKYKEDEIDGKKAKKGKAYSTDLTKQFKAMKPNKKDRRTASKRDVLIKRHAMKKSKTAPPPKSIEMDGVEEVEDDGKSNSPSYSRESIDIPIFQQSGGLLRSGTAPQIGVVSEGRVEKTKRKVSDDEEDGIRDSDESSLNEDEDDDDEEEEEELKRELEEDFELNFQKFHDVLDEYTHTIDDIETGRKILANKVVADTRRRMSHGEHEDAVTNARSARTARIAGGRQRSGGVHRNKMTQFQRKQPNTLMVVSVSGARVGALPRQSSKQFDVARSRRGSSFVDDYNLNETLFFDGAEENEEMQNADMMDMEEKQEQGTEQDDDIDPATTSPLSPAHGTHATFSAIADANKNGAKGGHSTPVIMEEDEDEDEDDEDDDDEEPEVENVDPLLGTIEDIIDEQSEYEEEEFKIFDLEKDTAMQKTVVFYEKLNEFIEWEGSENGKGIRISMINSNEYGKALFVETGIESGWSITHINWNDIRDKTKEEMRSAIEECDIENGYHIVFERGKEEDEEEDGNINDKSPEISQKNNLKPSLYMKSKKQSE